MTATAKRKTMIDILNLHNKLDENEKTKYLLEIQLEKTRRSEHIDKIKRSQKLEQWKRAIQVNVNNSKKIQDKINSLKTKLK